MRRKDREIKDFSTILEIFDRLEYGHLSLCDGGKPYGVTLNFGHEVKDGTLLLYFHAAPEGRKLDCLRRNSAAYFFAETDTEFHEGEKNGRKYWTMFYSSVAAEGIVEEVDDLKEKFHALKLLMKHFIGDQPLEVPEEIVRHTAILKMTVSSVTGKQNPAPAAGSVSSSAAPPRAKKQAR